MSRLTLILESDACWRRERKEREDEGNLSDGTEEIFHANCVL